MMNSIRDIVLKKTFNKQYLTESLYSGDGGYRLCVNYGQDIAGCEVMAQVKRSDGTIVTYQGSTEKGVAYCKLEAGAFSVVGECEIRLHIISADGSVTAIEAEGEIKKKLEGESVASDDRYPVLTSLIQEVAGLKHDCKNVIDSFKKDEIYTELKNYTSNGDNAFIYVNENNNIMTRSATDSAYEYRLFSVKPGNTVRVSGCNAIGHKLANNGGGEIIAPFITFAVRDEKNGYAMVVDDGNCDVYGEMIENYEVTVPDGVTHMYVNGPAGMVKAGVVTIEDKPKTMGVLNTLLRAKQFSEVKYTPIATLPYQKGDIPEGEENELTGIIYSSTRVDDKMVGVNVSLHTFMTALQNKDSVIYTHRVKNPGFEEGEDDNAETYYGIVCSAFVCYCLGIPYNLTTKQMTDWKGFVEVGLYNLQLGDFMVTKGEQNHTILITGIKRNKYGRIVEITTTESGQATYTAGAKEHKMLWSETYAFENFVNTYVKDVEGKGYNYRFFRYESSVEYVPSEYIPLKNYGEVAPKVVYPDIITNYGDKATILANKETKIVANVIKSEGYDNVKVFINDNDLGITYSVADVTSVSINAENPGLYEFRMAGETQTSSTFVRVVGYAVSVEDVDGKKRVSFSCSDGNTPLNWAFADDTFANLTVEPFTNEDIENGYVDIDCSLYNMEIRPYLKVYFRNEYGSVAVKYDLKNNKEVVYKYDTTTEKGELVLK